MNSTHERSTLALRVKHTPTKLKVVEICRKRSQTKFERVSENCLDVAIKTRIDRNVAACKNNILI